jgi:hypothetical protein
MELAYRVLHGLFGPVLVLLTLSKYLSKNDDKVFTIIYYIYNSFIVTCDPSMRVLQEAPIIIIKFLKENLSNYKTMVASWWLPGGFL